MRYKLTVDWKTNKCTLEYGVVRLRGDIDINLEEKSATLEFETPLHRRGKKEHLSEALSAMAPMLKRKNCSLSVNYGKANLYIEDEYDWEQDNKREIVEAIRNKRNLNFKERFVNTRMKELKRMYGARVKSLNIKNAICADHIDGSCGPGMEIRLTDELTVYVWNSLKYHRYIIENGQYGKRLATTTQFDKLPKLLKKLEMKSFLDLPLKTERKSKEGDWAHT